MVGFSVTMMGGSEMENFPDSRCQAGQTHLFAFSGGAALRVCGGARVRVRHVVDVGLAPAVVWKKDTSFACLVTEDTRQSEQL